MLATMSQWIDMSFPSSKEHKTFSTRPTSTRSSTSSSWESGHLLVAPPPPLAHNDDTRHKCGEFEGQELQASQDAMAASFVRKNTSTTLLVQETRVELVVEPSVIHADLQRLKDESIDETDCADDCPDEEDGLHPVYQLSVTQSHTGTDGSQIATSSQSDFTEDDRLLGNYYRNKENIVLDSVSPEQTPHIVITTIPDTWNEQGVAWLNRVDPQCPDDLMVPSIELTEKVAGLQPVIPQPPQTLTTASTTQLLPKTVFSHSKFNTTVESCSIERANLFLTNVVTTLRRHTCKAVAFNASQVALSYRKRYDAELPFSKIEKSFVWTDPAEPIISSSRFDYQTMIIDSPNPFRIPHIIINAAPPEDPWVAWSNSVSNPQDCGFGRYLTVQARGLYYLHEPEDWSDDYDSVDENDESLLREYMNCGGDDDEDEYGEDFISTLESYGEFDPDAVEADTDSPSSLESPLPQTPDEEDDFNTAFERALARRMHYDAAQGLEVIEEEEYDELALTRFDNGAEKSSIADDKDRDSSYSVCQLHAFEEEPASAWSCWGDEEEDELPSLDDEWYQSVIKRTQSVSEVQC